MKRSFRVRSILSCTLACLLLGSAAFLQAPLSHAESARHLARRVHKVQKKLVKYPPGTYLRLVFLDYSQTVGVVDRLHASTFTFTDADDNAEHTYRYTDVEHVEKGDTYVGEGSIHRHRSRLVTGAIVGAVAAGAAMGWVETH
jgi:hypothetical protein